jgi:hypothetical protein
MIGSIERARRNDFVEQQIAGAHLCLDFDSRMNGLVTRERDSKLKLPLKNSGGILIRADILKRLIAS